MTAVHAPDPPSDGRVSTGTPGLDEMLQGGLVGRRPYLLVGPSGTGKTSLALQFLCEGVRHDEQVLLVTLEEPPNEIRLNHRGLGRELDAVEVFDAIPDIMRYERVPFKDIASVRQATPFHQVPLVIRRSPELAAVEVTMTGLEQMLRTEVFRRNYTRIVVDSLTALQYFCMKGFDPVAGAQAFLRFLSDLRVTTILTVESPLEDADTPERMLARGEIRLFRWELEDRTVRAIGVEKFRGSGHDVRLHPYRIGPRGIDMNLAVTISRDTRQIIEAPRPMMSVAAEAVVGVDEGTSPLDPLGEVVQDLVLAGADVEPIRLEVEAALGSSIAGEMDPTRTHISRATALALGLSDALRQRMKASPPVPPPVAEAYQRIVERSEAARAGLPPTRLPPPRTLQVQLEWVLSLLPAPPTEAVPTPSPASVVPTPGEAEARRPPSPPLGVAAESEPTDEPDSPIASSARPSAPLEPSPSAPDDSDAAVSVPADATGLAPVPVEPEASTGPPPAVEVRSPLAETDVSDPSAVPSVEPGSPAGTGEPTEPPAPAIVAPAAAVTESLPTPAPGPSSPVPPLRAWSPPSLPSGPLSPKSGPAGRTGEPPPLPPELPKSPAPDSRSGRRPPLPSFPSDALSSPAAPRPAGTAGPHSPPRRVPLPNVVPGTEGPLSPGAREPTPDSAPAPKRKRKTPATPRKRSGAASLPTAPEAGAEAAAGSTKSKRRPARKRKAPSVVSARAGAIPAAEPAASEAAPPPPPSPPPPTEPVPPPAKEGG